MAKKRRGRKMPAWRKTVKAAVGILGKGLGITVAASPAIQAIQQHMSNPVQIPQGVLYGYTGFRQDTGGVDFAQTARGVASIFGGIIIIKIFSYLARSV